MAEARPTTVGLALACRGDYLCLVWWRSSQMITAVGRFNGRCPTACRGTGGESLYDVAVRTPDPPGLPTGNCELNGLQTPVHYRGSDADRSVGWRPSRCPRNRSVSTLAG